MCYAPHLRVRYVTIRLFASFGYLCYYVASMLPAMLYAHVNASPTLHFLGSHLRTMRGEPRRIPSAVADSLFKVGAEDGDGRAGGEGRCVALSERGRLLELCGLSPRSDACVLLMVQRLAPEKGTAAALEALARLGSRTSPAATRRGSSPPRGKGSSPRGSRDPGTPAGARLGGSASAGKSGALPGSPLPSGALSLDGRRPVHLAIAGDGPSRATLEAYASEHELPCTFLGNLPNSALPPLYRASDAFLTCSTSETYGLTTLEALACGTPAVMPHCGVFDELWQGRVPDGWIYQSGDTDSLLRAMRAASAPGAKEELARRPVRASWADATAELLEQYEAAIQANLPMRRELATYAAAFNQLLRAAAATLLIWWAFSTFLTWEYELVLSIADETARRLYDDLGLYDAFRPGARQGPPAVGPIQWLGALASAHLPPAGRAIAGFFGRWDRAMGDGAGDDLT